MDIKDKVEAAKKATEGKLQEAAGRSTDNSDLKEKGEAKQEQAATIDAQDLEKTRSEDAKDPVG